MLKLLDISAQTADSLLIEQDQSINKKLQPEFFLATSVFIDSNWKGNNDFSFVLYVSLNLRMTKTNELVSSFYEMRSELGYQKFSDSCWIKTADKLFVSSIWKLKRGNAIQFSFNSGIKTQLANSWENKWTSNENKRTWKSGPLLPASFIFGTGFTVSINKEYFLNVSVISYRIKSIPNPEDNFIDSKIIAHTNNYIITGDYGFNMQSYLKKKVTNYFALENRISFFTKSFNSETTIFDCQNLITFFPVKHFKICIIDKMDFDFQVSENLQFRQEILLGFSL
jgi:hypothetical protein